MRQIRDANPTVYRVVKDGRRSLNSALAELSPPRETRFHKSDLGISESTSHEPDLGAQNEMRPVAQSVVGKVLRGSQNPAKKEMAAAVKPLPNRVAIEKALVRIKAILGSWFYEEVKAPGTSSKNLRKLSKFAKLTDAQMREIGPLLKRGWTFVAAFREVTERLTPAIRSGPFILGWSQTAEIGACSRSETSGMLWCGGRKKDRTLAKVKDTLAGPSAPQRS